jgi:hypothetical protein
MRFGIGTILKSLSNNKKGHCAGLNPRQWPFEVLTGRQAGSDTATPMVITMITGTTASENRTRRDEFDGAERWPGKFVVPPSCLE